MNLEDMLKLWTDIFSNGRLLFRKKFDFTKCAPVALNRVNDRVTWHWSVAHNYTDFLNQTHKASINIPWLGERTADLTITLAGQCKALCTTSWSEHWWPRSFNHAKAFIPGSRREMLLRTASFCKQISTMSALVGMTFCPHLSIYLSI